MPIGDGIRRNVATISQAERDRLRDAIITLNGTFYPGGRDDLDADGNPSPGGVSYWFKQDEIHWATHIHQQASFLPWHRELLNRFEASLRQVDAELSLHYWDWRTDPAGLFTTDFMGAPTGAVGEPWLSAGFYDPNADLFRSIIEDELEQEISDANNNNPFDPPRELTRSVGTGAPVSAATDLAIIDTSTYAGMWGILEDVHNGIHVFIGGDIGLAHLSFRDPFVFLLHSNVDRLFAMWQKVPAQEWRLDPDQVYGSLSEGDEEHINENMKPLDGTVTFRHPIRPWTAPENQIEFKNSRHISVVIPPRYDTFLPTGPSAQGDDMQPGEVLNPGQSISSGNGEYTFVYQGDGNLVLYRNRDREPLWASDTAGRSAGVCIMQGDGNLVIYGLDAQPAWASDTSQHPRSRLIVQNDGNVVIYRPDNTPVWATNTVQP